MDFLLKSSTYFRKYRNIGYIENTIVSISKVVDEIGAICLSRLSYVPRDIDEIVNELLNFLDGVSRETLRVDVISFYSQLVEDGFLSDGDNDTFEQCVSLAENTEHHNKQNNSVTTGEFVYEFFVKYPHIVGLHIELLSKCNERCIHCYIPHEKKNTEISKKLMFKAMDECKVMGTLSLTFSGGEPMLHPDFCEFLKKAKDLDFNVSVLSNLTILNDEIIKMLAYRHPTCVCVSLYSMSSEVHDTITNLPGSHKKTVNNILKLFENNIPVRINCVVMKQNKDSFHEVVKWGQEHRCVVTVDYSLSARNDGTTDNLDNRLTEDDLKQVVEKHISVDENYQLAINKSSAANENDGDERVCGVGMTVLSMNSNGDIYPCVGWNKFICGNLRNTTLQKIWDSSPRLKFLRKLRMKDFKQCQGCKDKEYCHVCISLNSNEDSEGNIFNIPKITCDIARVRHIVSEEYRKNN